MKRSKRIFGVLFALLVIVQLSTVAFAKTGIPSATSDFYVNDFAGVFTSEEKQQLMEKAVSLADNYNGIQVVITTVKSLDGQDIDDYAVDMYNQYGIGKDDMGVLILLSTGDRQITVKTGRTMEAYINDSKAGRFMDKYAIPYLKENKFNEGLISLQENLINEIITMVESEANTESSALVSGQITTKKDKSSNIDPFTVVFLLLALLLSGGIIVLVIRFINKEKKEKETIANLTQELEETKTSLEEQRRTSQSEIKRIKRECEEEKSQIKIAYSNKESYLISQNDERAKTLQKQISNAKSLLGKSREECADLKTELSTLKDRYERILSIYPSADEEVDKMIAEEIRQKDMAAAQEVDDLISEALTFNADKDNIHIFENVISKHSDLTETQTTYLSNDINKVRALLGKSVNLKQEYDRKVKEENDRKAAEKATKVITAVLASITIGNAANLEKLREARREYDRLSFDATKYFDNSLIQRLHVLLTQAQADYEEQERIKKLKKAAGEAEQKIRRKISYCYGKASELSDLEDAMDIYNRLSRDEKEYFDGSLLRKLTDLIEDAKRDKRRKEDEERRRREEDDDDDSFYGGSSNFGGFSSGPSSFGGFGGRTGGGGATRGF